MLTCANSASKYANGQAEAKNALIDNMHDYLGTESSPVKVTMMEEDFPPLPVTPSKPPAVKQRKVEDRETSTLLSQFSSLSQLINSKSDALEKMVSDNSSVIAEVKESFDSVCAEIKSMKDRVDNIESRIMKYDTHDKRISHLESYSCRWNLKLYGLEEKEKQDVRGEVIQVCQALLQDTRDKLPDVINTVHRLGPRKASNTQPRGIILQFTSRIYRDAVWRSTKNSTLLKNKNLKLAEDLSAEDREEEQAVARHGKGTEAGFLCRRPCFCEWS